MMVKKANEK
jgi:hypothetical protein